jgi:hypothetical protein
MISLSPVEVERRFELLGIPNRFTNAEKLSLNTTPLVEHEGRVLVFATPEDCKGLNILKLREICGTNPAKQPCFFDHPWYLEEPFGRKDCEPGWHAITMDVVPASISQPFNYSSSLEVPRGIEVVLALFLHYAGTGEQLLVKKHTWTNDEASLGRVVTVGAFGRNGVFISGHPADYTSRGLGICPKRSVVKG